MSTAALPCQPSAGRACPSYGHAAAAALLRPRPAGAGSEPCVLLDPGARRFEHLALEYDSDEIGDLEDGEVGPAAGVSVDQFGGLMDEFLAAHATPGHAHEGGQAYHSAAEAAAAAPPGAAADEDAAIAIAKARAALGRPPGGPPGLRWCARRARQRAHGLDACLGGICSLVKKCMHEHFILACVCIECVPLAERRAGAARVEFALGAGAPRCAAACACMPPQRVQTRVGATPVPRYCALTL
jgi:hypothetical protein